MSHSIVTEQFVIVNPGNNRALAKSGLGVLAGHLKVWVIPAVNWKKAEELLKAGAETAEKSGKPVKVDKATMKPAPASKKTTKPTPKAEPVEPSLDDRMARLEAMIAKLVK